MTPMGDLPEYMAAWNCVTNAETEAGRAALAGGTVRGDYLAVVVADVVRQVGWISGTAADLPHHPVSLRPHPASGYVLEYIDAVDHGLYEHYADTFATLWQAALRYVRIAWRDEIHGYRITWPAFDP